MLTETELEAALKQITGRIDEVNRKLIKKIAAQLLTIEELNATSIQEIIVMVDMNADIQEITRELAQATALNVRDIHQIYQAALNDSYTEFPADMACPERRSADRAIHDQSVEHNGDKTDLQRRA